MTDNKLTLKYNIDWNSKPYSTNDLYPKGTMNLYLNKVFQTYKTKAGKEKCLNVIHNRKIMKFIIQAGSQENIEHFEKWLKENSKLWLQEFEKICDKGR